MKKQLICLSLIFLIVSIIPQISFCNGENWLTGWTYRKSHTLTGSSGAGTNYQVELNVYYGSGSDSGSSVYLNSKCETDFNDVRFTDNDGDTTLNYWIESYTDSVSAIFWIEVLDNLDTDQIIYIYYGNNSTSSDISIDNTFPFGDDFNRANSATVGNGWVENPDIGSINNNMLEITATDEGTYREAISKAYGLSSGTYFIEAKINPSSSTSDEHTFLRFWGDSVNQLWAWDFGYVLTVSNTYGYLDSSGWHGITTDTAGIFHLFQIEIDFDNDLVNFWWDDSEKGINKSPYSAYTGDLIAFGVDEKSGETQYVDYIFMRKFDVGNISHDIWGSEETEPEEPFPEPEELTTETAVGIAVVALSLTLFTFAFIIGDRRKQ